MRKNFNGLHFFGSLILAIFSIIFVKQLRNYYLLNHIEFLTWIAIYAGLIFLMQKSKSNIAKIVGYSGLIPFAYFINNMIYDKDLYITSLRSLVEEFAFVWLLHGGVTVLLGCVIIESLRKYVRE